MLPLRIVSVFSEPAMEAASGSGRLPAVGSVAMAPVSISSESLWSDLRDSAVSVICSSTVLASMFMSLISNPFGSL